MITRFRPRWALVLLLTRSLVCGRLLSNLNNTKLIIRIKGEI
nr:MAG TPA: hypothetical protein [Caudoviricetes sp.]